MTHKKGSLKYKNIVFVVAFQNNYQLKINTRHNLLQLLLVTSLKLIVYLYVNANYNFCYKLPPI